MSEAVEYLTLSNSKAKTWRRCPKQFEFKYKMNLKSKKRARPLELGSFVHELMQWHYDGMDWKEAWRQGRDQFYGLFEEEREDLGDIPADALRIFTAYLRHYRDEDQHYHIIDTELDEVITLPNGLRFRMIIDLVVEEPDGGIWLWDHKNVGNFMPVEFMLLDSQLSRYFWGAQYLGYKPLRGILFNELITKPPTLPKLLKNGKELEKRKNIRCDYYTYLHEVKRHNLPIKPHKEFLLYLKSKTQDDWFRRTRLPKDAPLTQRMMQELTMTSREIKNAEETDSFPRTPDKSCVWGCDYTGLCQLQLQGADIRPMIKQGFTERTPRKEDA